MDAFEMEDDIEQGLEPNPLRSPMPLVLAAGALGRLLSGKGVSGRSLPALGSRDVKIEERSRPRM